MAKGRMINKEICESDSFATLNDSRAQLLCCLLTPWWDDHGKMIGEPEWIKGNIVRKLRQFTLKEISRCLGIIDKKLDVQWWQDEKGNKWLYWPKFNNHQTISQDKLTKDKLPSPKIPKNPQENPITSISRSISIREDKEEVKGLAADIINDLNLILGTSYKPSSLKTQQLIKERLNEDFTLEDFKVVHRKMLRAWGTDEKMVKFLRPITLYGPKFESYLNQKTITTKLTPEGVKAYLIGQEWLKNEEVVNVK
jgi:uncharacterized phage protein (TIGR02220 family)